MKDTDSCVRLALEAFRLSRGCVWDSWSLLRESIRWCRGFGGGSVTVYARGLKLLVPVSQLPEAWLNIIHVFCLEDYGVYTGFRPRRGWRVLDAGAFLGFYTLWSARLVGPTGRVVAVEPNPSAREFLYENILVNGFDDRVSVDPRALCRGETATLHVPGYWGNASLLKDYAEEFGETRGVRVRCTSLEQLLVDHGVEGLDLAKIDIEGYESMVLSEACRLARRVVVELHPPYTTPDTLTGGRWLAYRLSTGSQVVGFGECGKG